MEVESARFRGPRKGFTKAIAIDTTGNVTDLSAITGFDKDYFDPDGNGKGKYIAFIATQAVQLQFDPTTATVTADTPQFPAGVVQSFICEGKSLGWKAAVNGTLYIWPAS